MSPSENEDKTVTKKWKMNAKKVAFAKHFPGRLKDWHDALGKEIKQVVVLEKEEIELVIFSDTTFIFVPDPDEKPALLIRALLNVKPYLESHYKEAYETLDELILVDKELQRMARLENIMGAIRNNYPEIPELKTELRRFLGEIE
ncbi:hypothetical protein JYT87_00030 [Nitrospira defluvii]|nr:hypothetical protein [Nitrospira defluvii]